tara:strand:- start:12236 stop:12694 length:459 start_codon:yes stop_codon:yes gene_type:complete
MATRGLFSGKRVVVSKRNMTRNTRYTINVTNLITGEQRTTTARTKGGKLSAGVDLDAKGVIRTVITDSKGFREEEATVVTADIDCCIAKLVHDAINCTCKCDKCKEDLKLAEKIFLLLQAAEYDATLGITDGATDKYNKAKELCTERCACGC